jgi:thiol-disulfide isomerase/thioredoxin
MPPTKPQRRRRPSRLQAGVVTAALLLAAAGVVSGVLPLARADAATAIGAGGASNDLPPARAGIAAAGLAGSPPPPPPGASTAPAELTSATLGPVLGGLPASHPVLLEFYAHWCPTCRRFQPEYEAVAAGLAAGSGPRVFVARLDCANDVSLGFFGRH